MFLSTEKIKFIPSFLLKILLIYFELVMLATLGMPDLVQQKQQYQFVGNFDVYLHVKIVLTSHFS